MDTNSTLDELNDEEILTLAETTLNKDNRKRAYQYLQKLIKRDAHNYKAHLLLGHLYFKTSDFVNALIEYRK